MPIAKWKLSTMSSASPAVSRTLKPTTRAAPAANSATGTMRAKTGRVGDADRLEIPDALAEGESAPAVRQSGQQPAVRILLHDADQDAVPSLQLLEQRGAVDQPARSDLVHCHQDQKQPDEHRQCAQAEAGAVTLKGHVGHCNRARYRPRMEAHDEASRPAGDRRRRHRTRLRRGTRERDAGAGPVSSVRRAAGLARSLLVYHAIPGRQRRLRRLYRRFVAPGDLVFDLGAHVGNRTRAFRALDCRVVALEPQPDCARVLRAIFRDARNVTVVESAVGATAGRVQLTLNERHPTLSTAADAWLAERRRDPRFANIRWNRAVTVASTTLDDLIGRFGRPAFVKIDVEGGEPEVLAGLATPARGPVLRVPARRALLGTRLRGAAGRAGAVRLQLVARRIVRAGRPGVADRRRARGGALDGRNRALRRRLRPPGDPGDGTRAIMTTRFDQAQVRGYYDRHTATFLRYGQGGGEGAIHRAVWGPGVETREAAFHYAEDCIARHLRDAVPADAGLTVVDLGCGVGGSLCRLAERLPIGGAGVTLSPVQARIAAERIRAAGLEDRIRCVEGDYTDPELELPAADLAYAIESFVHGPDPTAFFARCNRIVRPGGLLVICDDMLRPSADRAPPAAPSTASAADGASTRCWTVRRCARSPRMRDSSTDRPAT